MNYIATLQLIPIVLLQSRKKSDKLHNQDMKIHTGSGSAKKEVPLVVVSIFDFLSPFSAIFETRMECVQSCGRGGLRWREGGRIALLVIIMMMLVEGS
jgi:hypothetical protein